MLQVLPLPLHPDGRHGDQLWGYWATSGLMPAWSRYAITRETWPTWWTWLRNETNNVENTLETRIDEDLNKISRKLIGPLVRNYTVLNILQEQLLHMRRNVTKGINRIGEMNSKIERIDLSFMPRIVDQVETIRWPVTFGLMFSLILFCMLLLCGTCKHSRCLLILFSVLGLLSIVISFVLTSLYLGLAVGGADFCFNPKPFITKQLSTAVSPLESTIVQYYLECDIRHLYTGPTNNPFRKQLRDIRKSLDGFEEGLFRTGDICEAYCPDTEVKATLRELKKRGQKDTGYHHPVDPDHGMP